MRQLECKINSNTLFLFLFVLSTHHNNGEMNEPGLLITVMINHPHNVYPINRISPLKIEVNGHKNETDCEKIYNKARFKLSG